MRLVFGRILLGLILALGLTPAVNAAGAHPPAAPGAGTTAAAADHGTHAATDAHGADVPAELLRGPSEGLITGITTLIVFLFLVVVLGKFAWGPISTGLKAREDKIRKDIEEAEAARARAEKTLAQYNTQLAAAEEKVRQLLATAGADAEKLATNVRMKAQADAEEIKERATKDIEAARDAAVADFRQYAAEVATSAAEKIIRRNLNANDQQDLVRQSLDQLQSLSKN